MNLVAFGQHTVKSLLESNFFVFKKILLLDSYKKDKSLWNLLKKKNIPCEFLNKVNFSRHHIDKKEQGMILYLRDYFYSDLNEILKNPPKNNVYLFVMLDHIEDTNNFGSIIRTSAALNIDAIIIEKKNQVPVNNTVIKVSAGGIAYIPICRVVNLNEVVVKLKKEHGFNIFSAVCSKQACAYDKFIFFKKSSCFIFGNEHSGIRQSLVNKSTASLYIPMHNSMNSLNVVVSCGIICSRAIIEINKE